MSRASKEAEASLRTVIAGLADVTDKTQRIVHDEIELVKAEVSHKAKHYGGGAAVAAAAGIFVLAGALMLLHGIALGIAALIGNDSQFLGYLIEALLLFVLAGIAGFVTMKLVKGAGGAKPTMSIEEAKLLKGVVAPAEPKKEIV